MASSPNPVAGSIRQRVGSGGYVEVPNCSNLQSFRNLKVQNYIWSTYEENHFQMAWVFFRKSQPTSFDSRY